MLHSPPDDAPAEQLPQDPRLHLPINKDDSKIHSSKHYDLWVKNPANAGDVREVGWIPGLGSSPGGGHGNPLPNLAWEIPWTEEPGCYSPGGRKRVKQD